MTNLMLIGIGGLLIVLSVSDQLTQALQIVQGQGAAKKTPAAAPQAAPAPAPASNGVNPQYG